jgi:hypothetical protein
MKVRLFDLEDDPYTTPYREFVNPADVMTLIEEKIAAGRPFTFELFGENGFMLTFGIEGEHGNAQYSPADGSLPYLMAVDPDTSRLNLGDMDFIVGGTLTPIDGRYRVPADKIMRIVRHFLETGERSSEIEWEEI